MDASGCRLAPAQSTTSRRAGSAMSSVCPAAILAAEDRSPRACKTVVWTSTQCGVDINAIRARVGRRDRCGDSLLLCPIDTLAAGRFTEDGPVRAQCLGRGKVESEGRHE